jgi:uncharacterized HAD superfamily protein
MTRILVDYDATIAATDKLRIQWINERFGTNYVNDKITTWLNTESGYMKPEHDAWAWSPACFLNESFQAQVEPVEGSVEGVLDLLHMGHEPMIVSDRPSSLFEVTRDWLDKQGLDMVRLLFTRHKHSMSTEFGMTKQQAAYLYKLRTVIEDGPHHATTFATKDHIDSIFLIDYPYNRYVEESPKIERVKGWDTIVERIRESALVAAY